MGVLRAVAGESAKLAAAEDEKATAMAPQSGRLPPPIWRGQDDPKSETQRAAGSSTELSSRERLKRLGHGVGGGTSSGHAPLRGPSLRAANQPPILNNGASVIAQLALGMPRGMKAGTMGIQRSQSTALGANSWRTKGTNRKEMEVKTEEAVCWKGGTQKGRIHLGEIQVQEPLRAGQ